PVGSVDGTGNAARFYGPFGVAVDGTGNIDVADLSNRTIRRGMATGPPPPTPTPTPIPTPTPLPTGEAYVVTDMGTLGGASSIATAINNYGQVTGQSTAANGQTHAFFYSPTA